MFSDSEVTLVRACTQGTYALDRKTNLRSTEFGNHLHKNTGSRKNLILASTLCTVLFCLSQKRSLI